MSGANAETVRAICRGWNGQGPEGMLPFFHEGIEYLPIEERGTIRGHGGMRRYFERWMESWTELNVTPSEVREIGDRVFNAVRVDGRGRGSGIEVAMEYWQVWTFREDKAARWEEYLVRDDALAAVGLSESDS